MQMKLMQQEAEEAVIQLRREQWSSQQDNSYFPPFLVRNDTISDTIHEWYRLRRGVFSKHTWFLIWWYSDQARNARYKVSALPDTRYKLARV